MATTMKMEARTISVEEAAKRLGIGRSTAKRLVAKGELPSIKLGARRLVPVAAIDRLIAEAMETTEHDT